MTFKEHIEKRFDKINSLYVKFEIPVPSLELYLYKRFPNNKWIGYLTIHIIDFAFICFWLWSLYFVASIGSDCHNKLSLFRATFENCSDFTCSNLNASKLNITFNKLIGVVK